MEPEKTVNLHAGPAWSEIFKEIAIQLRNRGHLVARRFLLLSTPIFLFFAVGHLVLKNEDFLSLKLANNVAFQIDLVLWGTIGIIVFIIIYMIGTAISKAEQVTWLDSYFDGKNLTPQESFTIAKKLFFAWSRLHRKLFYRYYVWLIVVPVVLFFVFFYIFSGSPLGQTLPEKAVLIGWSSCFFIFGVALIFWTRWLKITLSYAPFLFFDRYQGETSSEFWRSFFAELKSLNEVSKGPMFMKNVMLVLGADVAMTLVEWIRSVMVLGVSSSMGLRVSSEVGHRLIYFAKMTGRYVLYRFAYRVVNGEAHHVNEYIYNLKNK